MSDKPGTQRAVSARRVRAVGLAVVLVGLSVAVAVDTNRVLVGLLVLAAYLGALMVFRSVLARHDRPLWVPVAAQLRAGKLSEDLLQATVPQLAHPGLRTSAAVALAHLRGDRGDWDGARACLGRMGAASRAVVRRSLGEDPRADRPRVTWLERLMLARVRLEPFGGSDLPSEVLFCAGAILHVRGLYARALALGQRAWRIQPDPVTAYNTACAAARLGEADTALDWLRRALDGGYPCGELLSDDDFGSLRALPAFMALAVPPPHTS